MGNIMSNNDKVVSIPLRNTVDEQTQIHTVGTESKTVEIRQVSSGFGEEKTSEIQMAA
jgi:hypothetical protein